jgi:putative ABC transport system permease protein
MYLSGADIVVTSKWESNIDSYPKNVQARLKDSAIYKQPDFSKYYSIAGVESAARVLTKKEASCIYGEAGKMVDGVYLMGIVPDEFGKTAHFDTNLLKIHWFNYLNAMTQYPNALLLSNSFKKQGIKEGDIVRVKWKRNGDEYADGFVAGFIDFWPSYNPNEAVMSSFIVGNLYYLQQRKLLEPYQVWLKQDGTVKTQEIYDDIINKIPNVTSIDFTNQKISNAKNDAVLQGTNGSLSLSFLSTIIITLIGFLIYWIFLIKGRIYQFGVFRSLGLTFKNVIRIIVYEQILISGAAIAIGAITGEINSRIFVPMIQMTSKTSDQILPFKIVAYMDDYIKLYAVVILMLISGFAILIRYASGIKMTQAIKLGED